MKKHVSVDPVQLVEMLKCFSNDDELGAFFLRLLEVSKNISDLSTAASIIESDKFAFNVSLRQLSLITVFCQEHIDIIHQLMKTLKYEKVTE